MQSPRTIAILFGLIPAVVAMIGYGSFFVPKVIFIPFCLMLLFFGWLLAEYSKSLDGSYAVYVYLFFLTGAFFFGWYLARKDKFEPL